MFNLQIHGGPSASQKAFRFVSPTGLTTWFEVEHGLIRVHTEMADGSETYTSVARADFVARAIALNMQAKRTQYPSEKKALLDLVACMIAASVEAKRQGDPLDPTVHLTPTRTRIAMAGDRNYESTMRSLPKIGTGGFTIPSAPTLGG